MFMSRRVVGKGERAHTCARMHRCASLLAHLHPSCVLSSRLSAMCVSQDAFFYSLVYDPQQKTLLADKGEIRVGNKYQADITDLLKEGA